MANKAYYWLGQGQVLIARKKYKNGEKIPASKVADGTLKKWIAAGQVGEAPFVTPKEEVNEEVETLQKKLTKAENKVSELLEASKDCQGCADSAEKIADLEGLLEAATADPGSGD